MRKTKIALIIIFAFLLVGIFPVKAQENNQPQEKAEDCSTYNAGDVTMSFVIPSLEFPDLKFNVGNVVGIKFFFGNGSKLAIPDVNVLVRVAKKGGRIVDEFFLPEKLAFKPGERKEASYEWAIPEGIEPGEYAFTAMLVRGKDLNVGLYNFEIAENIASLKDRNVIKIEGENRGEIQMKDVKINGEAYTNKGIDFEKTENVKTTQVLENTYAEKKTVSVEQKLYQGNYFSEENLLDSKTQEVTIDPKKQAEIGFDISKDKLDANSPVAYYLKTKITYPGNTGISTVVILNKKNYIGGRSFLNYFPLLTTFPLGEKEGAKIAFCFNDLNGIEKGKIAVVLKDEDGNEVANLSRDFDAKTRTGYFSAPVKESGGYDWLKLEANVSMDGKIVDKYEAVYNSEDFGIARKEKKTETKNIAVINNKLGGKIGTALKVIFLLAIIGLVIYFIRKNKNGGGKKGIKGFGGRINMLLLSLGIVGSLLGFSHLANAAYAPIPVKIIQQSLGFTVPDTSAAVGFNCGSAMDMLFSDTLIPYVLRVGGDNFVSQSADGGTFSFNKGATTKPIKFQFANSFPSQLTLLTDGNLNTYSPTSAADNGKWGNYSDLFNPYISVGKLFGDIDQSDDNFFWKHGTSIAYGRTNFLGVAMGFAWSVHPLGVAAGVGGYGTFIYPHFFRGAGNISLTPGENCTDFLTQNPSIRLSESGRCKQDCIDQYEPCKRTCCAENGYTDNATCVGARGSLPLTLFSGDLQSCLVNNCVKLKPDFVDWWPGLRSCYGKCEDTYDACNNNALENWVTGNPSLAQNWATLMNDALIKDADSIRSSNASVIRCMDNTNNSSPTGECDIVGAGDTYMTVSLKPRLSLSVFYPLGIAGYSNGNVCTNSGNPMFAFSASGLGVIPTEETYHVYVGGTRKLVVNTDPNGTCPASVVASKAKVKISEGGSTIVASSGFPASAILNSDVSSASTANADLVLDNGFRPMISWTGCSSTDQATGRCNVNYNGGSNGDASKTVTVRFDCYDMNVEKFNMLDYTPGNGIGDSTVNVKYDDGTDVMAPLAIGTKARTKSISDGGVAVRKNIDISVGSDLKPAETTYKIFVKDRGTTWPANPAACSEGTDCSFPMSESSKDIRVYYYPAFGVNISAGSENACLTGAKIMNTGTQPTPSLAGWTSLPYRGYFNPNVLPFGTDYSVTPWSVNLNLAVSGGTCTEFAWNGIPSSNFSPASSNTSNYKFALKRGGQVNLSGRISNCVCPPPPPAPSCTGACGYKCTSADPPTGCSNACPKVCTDCPCPAGSTGWQEVHPN